jgi:phage tail sheath gpL-like
MTIDTGLSVSDRIPGRYASFNIAAAARGLTPLSQRIVLVGILKGGSVAAATPTQIFSEADADAKFGTGTELALMCRWALKAARDYGSSPEIWGIGIAEDGTAAVQTLTVTGPATEAGAVVIRIAGREITFGVANGAVQNDIAADLEAAIDAKVKELPVTAASATNVVTCTHVTEGVNGNDVEYEVIAQPAGVAIALAQSVAGATAVDITASLDLLLDKDYDIVAIANHAAADVADLAAHIAEAWNPATKRWRHSVMAERGSIATGQALATAADEYGQMVVQAEGFRNTPAEIAAYVGTMLAAESDPARPWSDVPLPSLYLPDAGDIPLRAELNSAIAGGLFMLSTNEAQTEAKIVRAVVTQVTLSSVPFFEVLDYVITRSMYWGLRQIDIAQGLAFPRAKKNERTRKAVRSVTLRAMKRLEEIEVWQNVDAHAAELVVETDATVATRLNVAIPAAVVPPLEQIANVVNLIIE